MCGQIFSLRTGECNYEEELRSVCFQIPKKQLKTSVPQLMLSHTQCLGDDCRKCNIVNVTSVRLYMHPRYGSAMVPTVTW